MMGVGSGNAASSPDWGVLSEELQAVLENEGPTDLKRLKARYAAMHGRQLGFHPHELRDNLTNGNLKGLRFNTTNRTLELGIGPARVEASKVRSPTPPSRSTVNGTLGLTDALTPGAAAPSPPGSKLADELRRLVAKKGPILLSDVSRSYFSLYRKELTKFGGQKLQVNLKKGRLKGLRYSKRRKWMALEENLPSDLRKHDEAQPAPQPVVHDDEAGAADDFAPPAETITASLSSPTARKRRRAALQGAGAPAANNKKRPRTTLQRPVAASKRPVMASRRISDVGGASLRSPFTASSPSSPRRTELPYMLIDDRATWQKALATLSCDETLGDTLRDVCRGSTVVVQVNGSQLGSKAEGISLIKVGYPSSAVGHNRP